MDPASGELLVRDNFVAWVQEYGPQLTAVQRLALRRDIESHKALPRATRSQLFTTLGTTPTEHEALAQLLTTKQSLIASWGRKPGPLRWKDGKSRGLLRRTDNNQWSGYVVHRAAIKRALRAGWPTLPPEMSAQLLSVPPAAGTPTVELLPRGSTLELRWTDPELLSRRTERSQVLLLGVGAGASVLALLLAALLFARMRSEKRLSALRTDFVATVSHELRTPIASLRMLSELLAEGRIEQEEQGEVHQALAQEARRLSNTVHRLLTFSRMQAGKQRLSRQNMALAKLVGPIVDAFEQRFADQAPVKRSFDAAAWAEVDPDALSMAIENLLLNAHKYAPDGTPYEVNIQRRNDEVQIEVTDCGPGIAKTDQQRIFEPFERADDRLSEATEGSGIGLSLVRHVARSHGGDVRVRSTLGKGATFIITIPATTPEKTTHE